MKSYRLIFGFAFWVSIILLVLVAPILFSGNDWVKSLQGVSKYVKNKRQHVKVNFDRPLFVKTGTPIFVQTENGLKRIGQVVFDRYDSDGRLMQIESTDVVFYGDSPPITNDCYVTLHQTPNSFEWAVKRLFPQQRQQKIIAELKATFILHQKEIIGKFSPIVLDTLRDVGKILQEDLRNAFLDKQDQLSAIAARYQEGFVEKRLIPLVKDEIWPIVEARSRPIMDEVGSEIWKRASLWRFGWRLAYDKFPLTNSNLVQQEWGRFVKNDAMPVLEEHSADFYALAKTILKEIAENSEVKKAGKEGVDQLLNDQEIKTLIKETLWKILFENDRLKRAFQENFSNERAIEAVRTTSNKFETKLREIGDEIFGTFEEGITQEFAGVLRNEILQRDKTWLILRYRNEETKVVNRLELAAEIDGSFEPTNDITPEFVMPRSAQ